MNELQNEFILQSAADLNRISGKLQNNSDKNLPENLLREVFRTLHTIKGTAQTFGFPISAHLAHTLENLLSSAKNDLISAADLKSLLPEGIEILAKSLGERNFQIPALFAEKIQKFRIELETTNSRNDYLHEIPEEFSALLSAREKSALNDALSDGNNLYVLEIDFEAAKFAIEFKEFRQRLNEKGEILAALPGAKSTAPNKLGFRIIFATREKIEDIIEDSSAEIIFEISTVVSNNLSGIATQAAEHGKTLARNLGKKIDFEISVEAETSSTQTLKLIFDALLHLVRNAVSHAIEEKGKVRIEIKSVEKNLLLSVSDDGKGLNAEKIRCRAIEKNLVSEDKVLSEREISDLIFAPDFSTAEIVTEISGRGVGLDAVKNSIENANGQISVKSEAGKGTVFEILLPQDFKTPKPEKAETENESDKN